jgi:phosphoglycerol transferase MdoB-like AlkP superfamily enzyme
MRTLQIILHIVLLFKPLKFFGLIGGVLITAGMIYGIVKALLVGLGIPVLASLIVILGVQSFFFGLICDQISALRRERFS